jgi:hypothetical protein
LRNPGRLFPIVVAVFDLGHRTVDVIPEHFVRVGAS